MEKYIFIALGSRYEILGLVTIENKTLPIHADIVKAMKAKYPISEYYRLKEVINQQDASPAQYTQL